MAFMIDYEDDWRAGYVDLCHRVISSGAVRESRVGPVTEMRDYIFTLSPEAVDLPLGVGRRVPMKLAAAEAIQLCAGHGIPKLTEAVSSTFSEFVRDPDGTVHGNYGSRVGWQIIDIVDKLAHDPNTRQAVIQIWDAGLDSKHRVPMPRDIPCTLDITFGMSVDGKLAMSVTMRSNDVWLGLPFDVFQFRQLQRTVANCLSWEIGQYCHHAVSMHAYDRDTMKICELKYLRREYTNNLPGGLHPMRADDLVPCMFRILTGVPQTSGGNQWYQDQLQEAYASLGGDVQ